MSGSNMMGRVESRGFNATLILDAMHLLNERNLIEVEQVRFQSVDENGNPIAPNPNYLQRVGFEPARTLRLGMEVKFQSGDRQCVIVVLEIIHACLRGNPDRVSNPVRVNRPPRGSWPFALRTTKGSNHDRQDNSQGGRAATKIGLIVSRRTKRKSGCQAPDDDPQVFRRGN